MFIEHKKSAVMVQGVLDKSFFTVLKKRKVKEVVVLEGRPTLEAAKTLCKELLKQKIKPILIADSMAGFLFYKDLVKEVWISYQAAHKTGALCDIGALILGVLGKKHDVPVNLFPSRRKTKPTGTQKDILEFNNIRVAPKGIKGYVPLVEFLPSEYITKVYA